MNPKQKGTGAETAVVNYARKNGFPNATRIALAGSQDRGDVILCPGFIIEVKAHKVWSDLDIDNWLTELGREVAANQTLFPHLKWHGVLIVKRPGKSNPAQWWAIEHTEMHNSGLEAPTQWRVKDYFECLQALRWGQHE